MAFARKKAPEAFSIEDMALEELIEAVHKRITALIDDRAAHEKQQAANVPLPVLRQLITSKDHCDCATARRLLKGD
jgi:hypothetical protein